MLRCVLELGADWENRPRTDFDIRFGISFGKWAGLATASAAEASQVGALRYALEDGAPFHMNTIWAAIQANSLECVRCACEHVQVVGLPECYDKLSRA